MGKLLKEGLETFSQYIFWKMINFILRPWFLVLWNNLLYASEKYALNVNEEIIRVTFTFLKASQCCAQPLFWAKIFLFTFSIYLFFLSNYLFFLLYLIYIYIYIYIHIYIYIYIYIHIYIYIYIYISCFFFYILGLTVSDYILPEFSVLFPLQLYYIILFVLYIFMKYVK